MKVSILGTIVSADYDCDLFASWIDKGVITPSSRIVSQIETASEPIELYISSYGGDVFAGGEMMIALQKAVAAGKLKSVEVGSIAASMAANIVASLRAHGVEVQGCPNSRLMFHGCYTVTEGGAQHHEDVATSLRNINDAVIKDLNAVGITECRAWFAEGREKWIGADEAVQLGLFNGIATGEAPSTANAKKTASRLAAFASSFTGRTEYAMELDNSIQAAKPEAVENAAAPVAAAEPPKAEAPKVDEPKNEPPKAEEPKMVSAEECEKRIAGLQAAKDKQIAALESQASELNKKISELTDKLSANEERLASVSALEERAEKAEKELAETQAALKAEQHARESVVTSALAAPAPVSAKSAREVLASLPMNEREAYFKAHLNELTK